MPPLQKLCERLFIIRRKRTKSTDLGEKTIIKLLGQGHQRAMSDNSNSANGNNWTIITPEAPVAENIGPVPEAFHGHGDYSSSVDPLPELIEPAQASSHHTEPDPSSEAQPELEPEPESVHSQAEPALGQSGTNQSVGQEVVSEGQALDGLDDHTQNEDSTPSVVPLNSVAEGHESTSLDEHVYDGYSEGHLHPSAETDLFSDSYTHISSTPGTIHTLEEEEGLQQEEEGLDEGRTGTEDVKLSESLQESIPGAEGESEGDGLRRRNVSLLGSLDRRSKDGGVEEEEEEEEGEEYRPPPARDEETGLSLNKCILGAVLLLGLGTIFFSEADDVKELKDQDLAQEWLKSEGHQDAYADMKPPGLMDKENEQIAVLQAQLQAQQEQLASAQQRLQEGVQEKAKREQLEQENQRMKGELESQKLELEKENVKMRREQERSKKELEGMSTIQKELSALKAKMGAAPSAGELTEQQSSHDPQDKGQRKDVKDTKKQLEKKKLEKEHKKEWKGEKEWKKEWKEEKEWKKDKDIRKEGGERKEGKEKKHGTKERRGTEEGKDLKHRVERKEEKDWKKKEKRAWQEVEEEEEGKTRKKEWKDKGERKEWKEDKKWKRDKSMDGHRDGERKEWREGEVKQGKKGGKEKEWKHGEEERARKEDKKRKGDDMSDGKEWKKKKEWKDREGEESDWRKKKEDDKKKKKEWNESGQKKWKEGKDHHNERKEGRDRKEERKHTGSKASKWSEEEEEEHVERKEHGRDHKWKKHREEHHKDPGRAHWHGREKRLPDDKKDKSGQSTDDKTSSHPHDHRQDDSSYSRLRSDYWSRQRQRLQHSHGPPAECSDAAACARAQGLVPVSLADFEALLLAYVDRLEGTATAEEQNIRRQELSKLVREFFAADGVFAHDRMPFSEFVEDVSDILEDMAEEEESQEMEDEMEGFEKEALKKFAIPEDEGKNGVNEEEIKKTSGRAKG